jgi:hypothetical protein
MGAIDQKLRLMATGPHGSLLEMNVGHARGISGDVSGTDYDGIVGASVTTTSAVLTGITGLGNLEGVGVSFRYPSGDSTYPYVKTYRTIKSSSESGGNTTITWVGDLPAASGTECTIRVGGCYRSARVRAQFAENPARYTKIDHVTAMEVDRVGVEARS